MIDEVLTFWFHEITPQQWWKVDPDFDAALRQRFGTLHAQACACELWSWRATPQGRLAEVLVLDQFSRNMYRGTPGAFAQDPLALALAQEAVALGHDAALALPIERTFLYMPYMHSESARVHVQAERLFRLNGLPDNHDFELRHQAIIERFGRYPHRNAILDRTSTPEEIEFLQQPGSSF